MSKQTAVDWLYNNLKSHFEHDGDLLEVVHFSLEQAKAMEKEQIIKARLSLDQSIHFEDALDNAEQYYNKTYKSE